MRVFKRLTGMPVAQYIRLRRLTLAAQLLLSTDHAVIEISGLSGYDDMSLFCKNFRRQFGVAPTTYRQRLKV